ncbi:hypothetical protein [Cardinium endosymbiont of Oedothorax gibbosus]|uniref:hypothetical protein n=1 Tax=Cardinium endosymbiont of Oedothorax gibbosus TaxID=931101 RepID=UPI002023CE68|nr:hypothetical protein [Cardinium endosymbiont of Oedothorax gibbosus]CAH2559822.1 MTH938-like superfamily protein [Cardinium endosymbiont of Oedothorax gibbosus]
MRYFIYLLSSWKKSLIAIVPLCLLWASTCPSEKKESETLHPRWEVINISEDNLDKDKCTITKCRLGALRFHVTDRQKCFNSNDSCAESENNIVDTQDTEENNWVLTPNFYGSVTKEKFPKTMQTGMKYKFKPNLSKEYGIPFSFLEEWLAVDPIDYKDVILIIATGIGGKLGVSEPLEKALEDKKGKGAIRDYRMLTTKGAIIRHNQYVKEGKKVFTFIHTAG